MIKDTTNHLGRIRIRKNIQLIMKNRNMERV